MSTKAYLIKDVNIKTNEDNIIFEKVLEKTPTFSLSDDEKIFNLFADNDCDKTGDDFFGELVMDTSTWEDILENLDELTPHEQSIIDRITTALKYDDIIHFECF